MFRIKPHTHQRWCKQNLVCTGPRERSSDPPQETEPDLPLVLECLLQRHGPAVVCHGDRGSGCSRFGRRSMWHKSSYKRLPLAPLQSCRADDPQTGEQLYQRAFALLQKVLGPTTDFPTWASSKGLRSPREFDFEVQCRELHQALLTKWRHGPRPLSSFRRPGPGMKELALVILTCFFLSSVELTGKNVKVLIVLERSLRKHKAFCSCAQKTIYKVTIDICSWIFTKKCPRMSTQAAA